MEKRIHSHLAGAGVCDICGLPTLIVCRDVSTGYRTGKCCIRELRLADALLEALQTITGICHPSPTIPEA